MKLLEYRLQEKITRAQAAAALGVSVPTYFKWEGGVVPCANNIRKIGEWSDGAVMANDLVGVKNGE